LIYSSQNRWSSRWTEYVASICGKNKNLKYSCEMPSEKWQMGDKDVDENITLR